MLFLCIFSFCYACHITLTASAFTDKGSYSYNSGKGPLHSQAVLLCGVSECFSVPCKDASFFPDSPHTLFSTKGVCLCCLTWSSMRGAGVHFTRLVWNPLRVSDTCTFWGNPALGHSGLSLSVYSPVNYLTIPSCNLKPYPAKLDVIKDKAICQFWQTQYTLILTNCFSSVMHIFYLFYILFYFPLPTFSLLRMHKMLLPTCKLWFYFACVCVSWMWICSWNCPAYYS